MRGGMNNDQCVYHVSFLLIVGDKGEGRRWRERSKVIGGRGSA